MFMSILRGILFGALLIATASSAGADGLPADCSQLIVAIAPDWNSMRGKLQLFERSRGGAWSPVTTPIPVLFGKDGLAWGSGLAGQDEPGLHKKERDGRAPAGVFAIGKVFGYDAQLPAGGGFSFYQGTGTGGLGEGPPPPKYKPPTNHDTPKPPPHLHPPKK